MHSLKKAQIACLKADKIPIKVSSKYPNFADIFSLKLATKLSKHTKINDYANELVDNWQPLYNFIYRLGPMELEILKTYIKNNLVNSFIRLSKFLSRVSIFFDKKPDRSLRLYIDYYNLNNLIIKN